MYLIDAPKCRLGFICHPKTGSQSARIVFRQLGAQQVLGHHQFDVDIACDIVGQGGIVASVVRNPFDTVVSWYFYSHYNVAKQQNRPILPFVRWVDAVLDADEIDPSIGSTHRWIKGGLFYAAKHCNRILRFETLQEDFSRLLLDCGLPECILEVKGKSNDLDSYRTMYGSLTRERVASHFATELKTFGYEF